MCLPYIDLLFFCATTQPRSLILPCALGAGSSFSFIMMAAFILGLYLLITAGGKANEKILPEANK
jgi:hypothetical protein